MACIEEHKVLFDTHMLLEEVEKWWDNACQRLEAIGTKVTWDVFRAHFLEMYFSEVVK